MSQTNLKGRGNSTLLPYFPPILRLIRVIFFVWAILSIISGVIYALAGGINIYDFVTDIHLLTFGAALYFAENDIDGGESVWQRTKNHLKDFATSLRLRPGLQGA